MARLFGTMNNRKLLLALAILAGGPLVLHLSLARRDRNYDQLLQKYECSAGACGADFNRDGRPERVERVRQSSTSSDQTIVVTDGAQEYLRTPYEYIDGTLRTHIAIRQEGDFPTLILFDGTGGGEPIRKVFKWNGTKLGETTPSSEDMQILTAMAARDDAGTWVNWGLYRALFVPVLLGYYALLVLAVSVLFISRRLTRRRSKPTLV